MDALIGKSLRTMVAGFDAGNRYANKPVINIHDFYQKLVIVFESEKEFLEKVKQLDELIDSVPEFASLREVFFDLLMINFLSSDAQKLEDDYLESKEWEKIEDKTLDRGTEMLNVFLYLKECKEENIEPELSDYLKEFLLVEEDDFQDEYLIYEDVIANQLLVDAELLEIARVSKNINPKSEVKEIFYPMMAFFSNPGYEENTYKKYLEYSENPTFDGALLAILYSYQSDNEIFKNSF